MRDEKETVAFLKRVKDSKIPFEYILELIDKWSEENDVVNVRIGLQKINFSKRVQEEKTFFYAA